MTTRALRPHRLIRRALAPLLSLGLVLGLGACDAPDGDLRDQAAVVDELAEPATWRCEASCEGEAGRRHTEYITDARAVEDAAADADIACADALIDGRAVAEARCAAVADALPQGPDHLVGAPAAAGPPSVDEDADGDAPDGTLWKCDWHCSNTKPVSELVCVSTEPPVVKCGAAARVGCQLVAGSDTGVACYVP